MLIINDIHVGVQRKGGTTPKTQETLRSYLLKSLEDMLHSYPGEDLVILGDLFDEFEVTPRDWIDTYLLLQDWVVRTGRHMTLVAGNHDWSPKGDRVSSFEVMAKVLTEQFGDRVRVIGLNQWDGTPEVIVVAHHHNQDMFDDTLDDILQLKDLKGKHILLHANFDNKFAAQGDHSLNVSREDAEKFKAAGATLVFAHEHQAKTALGGSVFIMGNQWPTSIADCLGNDEKFAHILRDGKITRVRTWTRGDDISEGSFAAGHAGYGEVDWRNLDQVDPDGAQFIRISGSATSTEASEVITAISKFRQKSSAFVVSNNVSIDGVVETAALPASFEAAKKFDVMEFIKKHLDPDEMVAVEKLMGEQQ